MTEKLYDGDPGRVRMPFGKGWKGKTIDEIAKTGKGERFLRWVIELDWFGRDSFADVAQAIHDYGIKTRAQIVEEDDPPDPDMEPDWETKCSSCGATPVMPLTGLCGPCSTGEAATAGGNWNEPDPDIPF